MIAEAPLEVAVTLEVERVTPADREALVAMYLVFEPKGASLGLPPRNDPGRWLDKLAKFPNFLIRGEGRIAGHAVLCPCGASGEVAIFIHQDYRGRGLGRRLLTALIEEARRIGLRHVWGTTELDNLPMLRLALRLGFRTGQDPATFSLDLS